MRGRVSSPGGYTGVAAGPAASVGGVGAAAGVEGTFAPTTSQTLTDLSSLPLASVLPLGENATEKTAPLCPVSVRTRVPVWMSQSLTVPSALPVASVLPSGEYATDHTAPSCPARVRGLAAAGELSSGGDGPGGFRGIGTLGVGFA